MDDLISRQAIDAVRAYLSDWEDGRYLCDYGDCVDFGVVKDGEWFVSGVVAWMPLPEPYRSENRPAVDKDSDSKRPRLSKWLADVKAIKKKLMEEL